MEVAWNTKYTFMLLNLLFAFLAIAGQVGENVSLTLWAGAASSNCSVHRKNDTDPDLVMDPYFILSFASFSFVVFFGCVTLMLVVIQHVMGRLGRDTKFVTKADLTFPQWQFVLIGVCDALNGVLVVFASPPKRTAPFLQAILGNIVIPLTILARLVILRKKPTILKVISAGVILASIILCLVPVISGMDKKSKKENHEWLQQSTASRILWPLCFMIGFVPATLMNVFEEKSLKDSRKVNLFYLLFWTSLYQLVTVGILFWVDILPDFGYSDNIKDFGANYWFALKCFFGGGVCDGIPFVRGFFFILMYILAYIGSGLLLRYTEGATYLAIVQALVTPLGALFWSIFATDDCGNFSATPHADSLTYFSIGGIVMMVPFVYIYNIGTFTALKNQVYYVFTCGKSGSYEINSGEEFGTSEKQPLIQKSPILN